MAADDRDAEQTKKRVSEELCAGSAIVIVRRARHIPMVKAT